MVPGADFDCKFRGEPGRGSPEGLRAGLDKPKPLETRWLSGGGELNGHLNWCLEKMVIVYGSIIREAYATLGSPKAVSDISRRDPPRPHPRERK